MKKKKQIVAHNWFNKLTDAEQQIWRLVYYHPTFIRNRTFALDMLFCTIGTGLDWKDGKIVDEIEDNYLTAHKQDIYNLDREIYKKAYTNTFYKSGLYYDRLRMWDIRVMREYNYQNNCIAEYTLKNIEKAVTVSLPPKSFYPVGMSSNLMTVPKNVKPDWLSLAIETCDLILATDPLYKGSDGRLQNKVNIKLAKRQKIKLLKLQAMKRKDISIAKKGVK